MRRDLRCRAEGHEDRSGEEGFSDVLGSVEVPDDLPAEEAEARVAGLEAGMLCGACADALGSPHGPGE